MAYNVRDYGARGDGIHDDKQAIQKAIDAAWKAGGGTVYLPKGTYMVSGNDMASKGCILLRDNVTVQGDGMGQTIVKLQDHWDAKVTGIIRTPSNQVNHDITLRDLTIDGNMQSNTGEVDGFFTGVLPGSTRADQNILVERVEIHSVSRYGFDPHEQTIGLTIRDSVAHHNGFDGFTLDYLSHGLIENNISYANGRHGFNVVTSTHDMVLRNNVAYDNGDNGLVVQRGSDNRPLTDNITIEGGKYYNNGREGVLIKMSTDVKLTGAEVYGNMKYGVHIQGSERSEISNNKIYNNSQEKSGAYDEVRLEAYEDTAYKKHFAATDNLIKLNYIFADGQIKSAWSVKETGDSSHGNKIIDNLLKGSLKGDVSKVHAEVDNARPPVDDGTPTPPTATDDGSNTNNPPPPDDDDDSGDGDTPILYKSIIHGNADANKLKGTDGNDKLDGQAGNDKLYGMDGDDSLDGGIGNDLLSGAEGRDILNGGDHQDSMTGGDGGDSLYGGNGQDYMRGGMDDDSLQGGADNDTVGGDDGSDTLEGGDGADYVMGHAGNDLLLGGEGEDRLYGDVGMDTLAGGHGNDLLRGEEGKDTFVFKAGGGFDRLVDFEDGTDVIDISTFSYASVASLENAGALHQIGNYVRIDLDSSTQVLIRGVDLSHLDNSDFVF